VPAVEHLTQALIRTGRCEEARAVLRRLTDIHASPEESDLYYPYVWGQGLLERCEPEAAGERRADLAEEGPETLSLYARWVRYIDNPPTQVALGRVLREVSDRQRNRQSAAQGFISSGLGLIGQGMIEDGIAAFDSAARRMEMPETAMQAAEWHVMPFALGLEGFSAGAAEHGERALEVLWNRPDTDVALKARAATALAVLADRRGEADLRDTWSAQLDSLGPGTREMTDRPSRFLAALSSAADGDYRTALDSTADDLAYDSAGLAMRPFLRSALYLKRERDRLVAVAREHGPRRDGAATPRAGGRSGWGSRHARATADRRCPFRYARVFSRGDLPRRARGREVVAAAGLSPGTVETTDGGASSGDLPAMITLRTLGPVEVTVDGEPAPRELLWRKNLALLLYLARSPERRRSREHLVGVFWGDKPDASARHSLNEALRVIRKSAGEDVVESVGDQVVLSGEAIEIDADQLDARLDAEQWSEAVDLVRGPFLEGFTVPDSSAFEDWLGAERVFWIDRMVEGIKRHAETLLSRGDGQAAQDAAVKALGLDPFSDSAVRLAMLAAAVRGERAGALTLYDTYAARLADELGLEPDPETEALAERIRSEREWRLPDTVTDVDRWARRIPLVGRERELEAALGALFKSFEEVAGDHPRPWGLGVGQDAPGRGARGAGPAGRSRRLSHPVCADGLRHRMERLCGSVPWRVAGGVRGDQGAP